MDNREGPWTQYRDQVNPHGGHMYPLPRSMSFRNSGDESVAQSILMKHKEARIEAKSSFKKAFSSKTMKPKFDQLEIFHALAAVVEGKEVAGPGVVEVLRDMFIAHEGNINFIPPKNVLKKAFSSKEKRERANLLETATRRANAEVVEVLAPYTDQTSKDAALHVALASRGSRVHSHDHGSFPDPNRQISRVPVGGQDIARKDRLIEILISKGANGSSAICPAVGFGDVGLLGMLLEGQPSPEKISEALPVAVAFRSVEIRHVLARMLLERGANANYNDGEAISLATRAFDTECLDMLLRRSPQSSALNNAFAAALTLNTSQDRFIACEKLLNAGAYGAAVNKALNVAVTTEAHNDNFLKLILPVASIDWENGHALTMTITNNHPELLDLMLEKRPNEKTFDQAFEAAMRKPNPRDQQKYCRTLLDAGPGVNASSRGLLTAVKAQKEDLCMLFIEKGASPDFEGGAPIIAATLSQNLGILRLLVSGHNQPPDITSLIAAFQAALSVTAPRKKIELLRPILAAGVTGPPVDTALINAAKQGSEGILQCMLFVEHGASLDFQGGEALDFCVRSGYFDTLESLLTSAKKPSIQTMSRLFDTAQKDPKHRLQAMTMILQAGKPEAGMIDVALDKFVADAHPDMNLIEVLLAHGASVHYKGHNPIITAAKKYNIELLNTLFNHSSEPSAATEVFDGAARTGSIFWDNPACFATLSFLAEQGAEGRCLDKAFLKAVGMDKAEARKFETQLLQYPLDINYNEGEALQIASERGDWELVAKMIRNEPSADSISMALPYIFMSDANEAVAAAILETFLTCTSRIDPYFPHPTIREPLVFSCLKKYPTSVKMLQMVLEAGFPVDGKMSSDAGDLTALYYTLASTEHVYRDDVVMLLINRGADLHNHSDPLLFLAIKSKRHPIIECLLAQGADVDLADADDTTPLTCAVQQADLRSIQLLLDAKASPNDGSLHYAAYMVNTEAIKLLLLHGHDPNLPLPRTEGRPPLFELVLRCPMYLERTQGSPQQKEKLVKNAIKALIDGGAHTNTRLPRAENRSLIYHALDSPNPCLTTKALLEAGEYRNINADFNLYTTNAGFTFSPTMYVTKELCRGNKTQNQALTILLKSYQAEDKFWKFGGPQPEDFCGAPKELTQVETRRRADERLRMEGEDTLNKRLELQRKELAINAEAAQARMELEERQFRWKQSQDQQLHAAAIAKEKDRLQIKEAENALQLRAIADENEIEIRRMNEARRLVSLQTKLLETSVQARGFGIAAESGMKALEYRPSRSNLSLDRSGTVNRKSVADGPKNVYEEEVD